MTHDEAVAFLAAAGPWRGRWADVGAGSGTFTRAMAEMIGPEGVVYAIDRDERAVVSLRAVAARGDTGAARVAAVRGDMRDLSAIDELSGVALDGVLFANVLHFIRKPEDVLVSASRLLREGGRIVVIEYDRRLPNPWVPHPLPLDRLVEVARKARLAVPVEVGRRASAYHREMYCAVLARR
jgi:ubiquinone/menaquinone biosynthesis C-methylase UbiE